MKATNKILMIGLWMVLLMPFVIAEMPWDNNASTFYTINISSQDGFNENYTFTMPLNGSNLTLLSDCSNMFIIYQDTTEIDRIFEGNCTSPFQDELNVSFKMRGGTTLTPGTNNTDYSVWVDNLTNFAPSDNPYLVYPIYDNFSVSNASKWDNQGNVGQGIGNGSTVWTSVMQTVVEVSGNWSAKFNVLFPSTLGSNTMSIGYCEESRIGVSGNPCLNRGVQFQQAGSAGGTDNYRNWGTAVLSLGFEKNIFNNVSVTTFDTVTVPSRWFTPFNGYIENNTNAHSGLSKFIMGSTDGTVVRVDWVGLYADVNRTPTFGFLLGGTKSLFQLSPAESASVDGINTNFSCRGSIGEAFGANITNITILIYNTSSDLFAESIYINDTFALQTNNITVANLTNLTTSPDGSWSWSCFMADSDNFYTSKGNISFTLDTGIPSITLLQPILEGNLTNMLLSYSISDASTTSCFWSIGSSANQSQSCGLTNSTVNTTTIDVDALGIGYGSNQFSFYANDSLNNNNTITREIVIVERVAEEGDATALITQTTDFNITINDIQDVVDSADLIYNGTLHSATLIETVATNKTFSVDIPATPTGTLTYNWSITGIVNGSTDSHVYSSSTQEVSTLELYPVSKNATSSCVISNAEYTLNFTFRDEDSNDLVTGVNVTQDYNVWTSSESNSLNFSWTETQEGNSSYEVCIDPDFASVTSNFKIIYGVIGNSSREFNLQDHNLNNITQNITLYTVLSTNTEVVTFNVIDSNGIELEQYLVKIYIRDFGNVTEPNFLVTSLVTDFNGQIVAELDTSEYYLIEIWKDGTLVFTVEPFIIQEDIVTIVVPIQNIFDVKTVNDMINGITTSLTYSNTTGNVTATWSDPDSLASDFCLQTDNITSGSINAYSYACSSDSTGTLVQQIGNSAGTNFVATLRSQSISDNNYYVLETLNIFIDPSEGVFGLEGVYWTIMAVATIAMVAIPSVTGVVLTGIVGLGIMGVMLNFINLVMGIFMALALIGGIIIILVKD